ncbi:MAG: ribose-phosphate pyrophosphokinae [Bacteriovoracaceae bacterium]|nr:ribose-phosphate pyrophosphokinae [Bacteriovoracaceae bacterium]
METSTSGIKLFAFQSELEFANKIAAQLKTELSPIEEINFKDGEHAARPLVDVCGQDVCVIQSLHSDKTKSVDDKLIRLLFFFVP